jgi:hypothetical protein
MKACSRCGERKPLDSFSVDHIVPLKGRSACGLHVQDNLQVMPLLQNIRKHNKFEEAEHG